MEYCREHNINITAVQIVLDTMLRGFSYLDPPKLWINAFEIK